jgi:Bacterial protein of unknown function (DUF898)
MTGKKLSPDEVAAINKEVEAKAKQEEQVPAAAENATTEELPTDAELAEDGELTPEQQEILDGELKKPETENAPPEDEKTRKQREFEKKIEGWMKNPAGIIGIVVALGLYAMMIFGFAGYIQARIGNLVWNNTKLDQLSFKSTLRARDFIWLYFTNIIAIMLTFGLATPWAQIRMARYRASKLSVVGDVDLDKFVGDKKADIKATGEEIADMFDVDLSFG